MGENMQKTALCDMLTKITMCVMFLLSIIAVARYLTLGEFWATVTVLVIHALVCLVSFAGWRFRLPELFILITAGCFAVHFFTTGSTVQTFYAGHLIQGAAALAGCAAGCAVKIRFRCPKKKRTAAPIAGCAVILAAVCLVWGGASFLDKKAGIPAENQIWSVPARYDSKECSQAGTLEEFAYRTKAYATDERNVEKTVLVYLPYGYSEDEEYNILYLLHGTGDNERAWLETYDENKRMLDNMIAEGVIEPLIVVTPTFYVEDDCADDLDQLTYSFAKELRNDLIPAVEESYSTYAQDISEEAFRASRDHRAFAGLSRGAVTMYHSGFCANLDYFAWFGAFSGSRTPAQYFVDTIQTEEFAEYPIRYLYVTSGNFDFAMPGQVEEYEGLLEAEPRLAPGQNTTFDLFPMRYHSWGNWHLAFYNFLLKTF